MESLQDIGKCCSRCAGWTAEVISYMPFGCILRLSLTDQQGETWVLSFSECRSVSFRRGAVPLDLKHVELSDGYWVVSDEKAGFRIECRECFLLHEDDYLSG